MSSSFWLEEPAPALPRRRLDGHVDVAIVGGGVTGCSCALTCAENGLRVRLHEAREIAGGASGRNGGFALHGGAMAYDAARERFGAERAAAFWRWTERALDRLASLAGDAFRREGSLRLATNAAEADCLRVEYDALLADGFDVEWRDGLAGPLAAFEAGLFHPEDGAIQPARWVRRLAQRAAEAGADIREHEPVERPEELAADNVVIATDGYTHGLVPELDAAIRPTRGQVTATDRLPDLLFPRPHYTYDGFRYWHQTSGGRLIVGGFRDRALDEEWTREEATTPLIQLALEEFATKLIGRRPPITNRWAGIFGSTDDLLPLVGPVPGHDGLWVAAGYSGHGNVMGLACGDLVAQAILGRMPRELELFDPARLLE